MQEFVYFAEANATVAAGWSGFLSLLLPDERFVEWWLRRAALAEQVAVGGEGTSTSSSSSLGIGWWQLLDWAQWRFDGRNRGDRAAECSAAEVDRKWSTLLRAVLAHRERLVAARGSRFVERLMHGEAYI